MKNTRTSIHNLMECDLISAFPDQYSQEHEDLYHSKEKNKSKSKSKLILFGLASLVALGGNISGFNSNLTNYVINIKDKYFDNNINNNLVSKEEIKSNNFDQSNLLNQYLYESLTAASIFTISYISLNQVRKINSE